MPPKIIGWTAPPAHVTEQLLAATNSLTATTTAWPWLTGGLAALAVAAAAHHATTPPRGDAMPATTCHGTRYPSAALARRARRHTPGPVLRYRACPTCRGYHLEPKETHTP